MERKRARAPHDAQRAPLLSVCKRQQSLGAPCARIAASDQKEICALPVDGAYCRSLEEIVRHQKDLVQPPEVRLQAMEGLSGGEYAKPAVG